MVFMVPFVLPSRIFHLNRTKWAALAFVFCLFLVFIFIYFCIRIYWPHSAFQFTYLLSHRVVWHFHFCKYSQYSMGLRKRYSSSCCVHIYLLTYLLNGRSSR